MKNNDENNLKWQTFFCAMLGMFLSGVLFRNMLSGFIVGLLVGWMMEKLKKDG